MWHVLNKFNRVVARNVSEDQLERLLYKDGEHDKDHKVPERDFLQDRNVVGYVINEKPIYNYGQLHIFADGTLIAKVTRKEDAFRIMQALKRDYKEVFVCF